MQKRSIVVLAVIWLVIIVSGLSISLTLSFAGVSISGGALSSGASDSEKVLISAEEYEALTRYSRLDEVYSLIKDKYYIETDDDELILGAINGMLGSLGDPYSFYYTPEEMKSHDDHNTGLYQGIGLQLIADKDGSITVTRTFKDGPAQLAGIKAGDKIVMVNGESVSATTSAGLNEAVEMIQGAPDSAVKITISRDGSLIDFEVKRGTININRVEYTMLEGNIGYIMIYEFMGDDVSGFKEAYAALTGGGAVAMIIDVRSNPGGLLNDVVSIVDMLVPEGLIVYIEDRAGQRESFYSDANQIEIPLAVLTNGMSASASEILAGAVQDYGVGVIVGETTFGKGIVQTLIPFREDNAGVQMTTASYFTPKGRSIHDVGIVPDVEVSLDPAYDVTISSPNPERDAQLRAAMDILKEELK